ncbi:MAG: SulP family inorganic anion transporter [Casimicrobiaceae bacterium]
MRVVPSGLFPWLRWWRRVDASTLRSDAIAGLSGAILVLPQAIAYATIAGLPPQYGIYAAMVPAIVAALFGSSWHLVSGPTATVSIVVFATLSPFAEPGGAEYVQLALTLTLLAGMVMLAMGIARMGSLVNFVSNTVVIGFTSGAAVLIAASQLKNFFGLPPTRSASFADTITQFIQQVGDANPYVTSVAVATVVTGALLKRYAPRIPYMIGAMLVAGLLAAALNAALGETATGIATIGALRGGLPALAFPDLSFDLVQKLGPSAIAVALLGLTEAVSIARAVALKTHQRLDGNQEFIGQGLSNIMGSLFSAYATSGSFTRSGLNYDAGARTPLAAVLAATFLGVIVLFVAPLAAYLPVAAMGGILMMVAYSLIDADAIRMVVRTSPTEIVILLVTFIATLLIDLQFAIYIGVIVSLMLFLNRTSRPAIFAAAPAAGESSYHYVPRTREPDCPQLEVAFVEGPVYFGAIDHVQQWLLAVDEHDPRKKHVLLLAPGISFVDAAGMEMLAYEAVRRRDLGGGLYFHRLKESIVAVMRKNGTLAQIGESSLFPMGPRAIDTIYPRLDPEICRRCTARIFPQCHIALPDGEPRGEPRGEPPHRGDDPSR